MKIQQRELDDAGLEEGNDGYETEDGQVARRFSGVYTVGEVQAILADMLRLQRHLAAVRVVL